MSLTTVGVECRPISPFSRSICLSLPMIDALLEVDDAVLAEARDRLAGLGVQRDQAVAGGDVDDAVVALAVGPVGQAAARQLTRAPSAWRARPRPALYIHFMLAGRRVRARPPRGGCRPVAYTVPLTMIGVPSSLVSGRGPRLSVLNRHATSSLLKLLALIWSSGEYLLPRRSAVYIGHSPFLVLGIAAALSGHAWRHPRETCDEQRHCGHDSKCDALHRVCS